MNNFYLIKVWKNSKPLFFLFLFFILGQAFFSYKQVETTPFFNYGMYSEVSQPQNSYSTIALYTKKGDRINLFESPFSPTFLQYQLTHYAYLVKNNSLDPVQQTINNRFGLNSSLSNYLYTYLSTSKEQLHKLPIFIVKKTKWNNFFICKENYEWVKSNFKLVKTKNIIND